MIYFYVIFLIFLTMCFQIGFWASVLMSAALVIGLISVLYTMAFVVDFFTVRENLGHYALLGSPIWIVFGSVYFLDRSSSILKFFKQALSASKVAKAIFLAWVVAFLLYNTTYNYLDWNTRILHSALSQTEYKYSNCRTGYALPWTSRFERLRDSTECHSAAVMDRIEAAKADYPFTPLRTSDYFFLSLGLYIGLFALSFMGKRRTQAS